VIGDDQRHGLRQRRPGRAVEVSTDGGQTWRLANGRGTWTYAWRIPTSGSATIQARAADDSANLQGAPTSITVTVGSTAPAAPTGLVATANASGASLAWNDVPGAAGYHVYRSTSATSTGTRITGQATATSAWADTQAPRGAVYYRVTAVGPDGQESAVSAQASATVAKANILANPSFEIDGNADGRPDNWTSSARFTRSTEAIRSGGYAGRHRPTSNANYNISQARSGIVAGQAYTFDGWVNIPATTDSFTFALRIDWRNASNSVIGSQTVASYTSATGGWVRANGSYTAPTGATRATVVMASTSLLGPLYVDDLSLR
jgi:hypothetical protein